MGRSDWLKCSSDWQPRVHYCQCPWSEVVLSEQIKGPDIVEEKVLVVFEERDSLNVLAVRQKTFVQNEWRGNSVHTWIRQEIHFAV